jgi:hypothetical protein
MNRRDADPPLSNPAGVHLLEGCCLLGCELCSGARSHCAPGVAPFTLNAELAAAAWTRHKNALLTIWRDPDAIPAAVGFRPEGRRGAGRWIPCYAEVVFDGAPWPKLDKTWPESVKKIWDNIKSEIKSK